MRLAARSQALSVRHRVWEAALPLRVGIALMLGWFYLPSPRLRLSSGRHLALPKPHS